MILTMKALAESAAQADIVHWGIGLPENYKKRVVAEGYHSQRLDLLEIAGFDPDFMLAFAMPYAIGSALEWRFQKEANPYGTVSPMAWGSDYHRRLHESASKWIKGMESRSGSFESKICVDTTPLVDRTAAEICGMGHMGRNGFLIHPTLGTAWNTGIVLVKGLDLEGNTGHSSAYLNLADRPNPYKGCQECRACVRGCPTHAISETGGVDVSRCLSAVTQKRGVLSEMEMSAMGNRLYGCDLCQEVCPSNRAGSLFVQEPKIDLFELLAMSKSEFKTRYQDTGFYWRGLGVMKRNALIALGNALPVCEDERAAEWVARVKAMKLHENFNPYIERMIQHIERMTQRF